MPKPIRAGDAPIAVKVIADKIYFWCSCGKSTKQPFCDGSHGGTDMGPMKYTAKETTTVFFCACKATKHPPLCDGSHKK